MGQYNSCMTCGACCASYQVSFYWGEANDNADGYVPVQFTVQISPHRRAMKGTCRGSSRCIALEGQIGTNVRCLIYEQRPSTCRAFFISAENGLPNELCDKARARFGMSPFSMY